MWNVAQAQLLRSLRIITAIIDTGTAVRDALTHTVRSYNIDWNERKHFSHVIKREVVSRRVGRLNRSDCGSAGVSFGFVTMVSSLILWFARVDEFWAATGMNRWLFSVREKCEQKYNTCTVFGQFARNSCVCVCLYVCVPQTCKRNIRWAVETYNYINTIVYIMVHYNRPRHDSRLWAASASNGTTEHLHCTLTRSVCVDTLLLVAGLLLLVAAAQSQALARLDSQSQIHRSAS